MAEIQPNDIGLATFADVGDVANLQTNAKEIVAAINEVLASGNGSSGVQILNEGEDNVAIGSGNIIFGSHNRIFGTGNIIIGDNHLVIGSNKTITEGLGDVSLDWVDISLKRINFYIYSEGNVNFNLQAGDRVIVSIYQSWCDPEWSDWVSVDSGKFLTTVTNVSIESGYIEIADMPLSSNPPDSIHTVMDYIYTSSFYILRDEYKKNGNGSVTMGSSSTGTGSFSANYGNASGSSSAAFNSGNAKGSSSFACNGATANNQTSFAANSASTNQDYAAAFNGSNCYGYYSTAFNYARTAGRAIKCIAMSSTAKTLTAAIGENVSGLTGYKVLIRYKNNGNTIIYTLASVVSVSGQTIYLASDTDLGWGGYGEALISDGYVFRIESSYGYNLASGYGMAGGYYTQAHGCYTIAAHEGAVIYGKYGASPENYSWSLANGTSLASQGLAVKILQNGNICADGTLSSPCADYAELFEWQDGNPDKEDRSGYFVKLIVDKIAKTDEFDTPLGVISAVPAIIGDSGEMHWQGKYVTDDFGRIQYHDVLIPAVTDKDGNIIEEERYELQPVLNPDWDSSQEYVPRLKRPEWTTVGVLGKLTVYDDGSLQQGDLCRAGEGGKAVKSINNGYPVLKRIAVDKVLIWFRG
ncbi:MAG: peptidase G2 autoproteolytic cleavage domain-containing protein [Bacillota bacterium]|nr:peptidase G2 autoproteolytic cleavage domain-containing protein [Bacillota bacterium]